MLSLMAAIPLIPHSVGSVPAFAQSPANISQHLPLVVNRNPLLFWFFLRMGYRDGKKPHALCDSFRFSKFVGNLWYTTFRLAAARTDHGNAATRV